MRSQTNLAFELIYHARRVFPPVIILIYILIIVTADQPVASLGILLLIPAVGIITFQLSKKYRWYSFHYIWLLNGLNIFLLVYLAGNNSPAWLMSIPFITGALMLVQKRLFQISVLVGFIAGLYFMHHLTDRTVNENLTITGLLLLITVLMERSYHYLNRQTLLIHEQKTRIEEKQNEILDSIRYAERLQKAILPPLKLLESTFVDSFVLYKPKDIVAGDFYWMERKDNTIFFTAADCTGHGVPGAMVSIMCSDALTKSVMELGIHEPAKILDKTTELLQEHFAKSETEVKDGMDLALCSLDMKSGFLEYAGANNPLYIVRDDELIQYTADRQAVGKVEHQKPFTNQSIQTRKGDALYLFSDGFADQFGGPAGKKFKYKALKELFVSISDRTMAEQKVLLETAFEKWKGDLEQVDDVCMIGVRV